ncbi:MAG: prepilin-type N-terminal cleavage/methylation domain-containing protein [Actinobacteria bacterium]|nr:prepilin-type N-terminal cleavage/methylation domain-containing protein [Actinomycetota bacterium]
MLGGSSIRLRHLPQDGFTLVELLVTMLVAGIIASAVIGLFLSALGVFASEDNRMLSQDDARLAVNQLTRYLRMATSSASNTGTRSDAIELAAPQEIVFYVDLDGNGVAEKVRYYLNGTTLRMQDAHPDLGTVPPTYGVSYDSNGVVITSSVRNGSAPLYRYYRYDEASKALVQMTSTSTFDEREQIVAIAIDLDVNDRPKLATSGAHLSTTVQIRQRFDGGLK